MQRDTELAQMGDWKAKEDEVSTPDWNGMVQTIHQILITVTVSFGAS
jgi:hypothetical protein